VKTDCIVSVLVSSLVDRLGARGSVTLAACLVGACGALRLVPPRTAYTRVCVHTAQVGATTSLSLLPISSTFLASADQLSLHFPLHQLLIALAGLLVGHAGHRQHDVIRACSLPSFINY
jgi:hypothetical protein